MDLHYYQTAVFSLIILFFYLFSVLDGFDLGIGIMLPFCRTKEASGRLVAHISPFWDGNEVWLIIAASFVFAAFPAVIGLLLGTIYLPFLLLIAGLILRAMALEYSYHDLPRQQRWHRIAAAGSFLVVFLGLYLSGLIVQGLPFEGPGQLSQHPADYVSPFPLLFTLAGLVFMVWHGLTYALGKDPSAAGLATARNLWWGLAAATLVMLLAWILLLPHTLRHPLAIAGATLCLAGVIGGRAFLRHNGWSFRFSCLSFTGLWTLIATSLYPAILPARHHPEWSLTIAAASAPVSTLKLLLTTGLILIPVIIAYTAFTHKELKNATNDDL
jgi:cytochrome d ubiquinol oxidase subunit II